jgi:adenylate cyclase
VSSTCRTQSKSLSWPLECAAYARDHAAPQPLLQKMKSPVKDSNVTGRLTTGGCLHLRYSRLEQESQISPTSGFPRVATTTSNSKPASLSSNVSPKEHHRLSSDFGNYRRDLSVLETSGARIPQIQHNPPTAAAASPSYVTPWMSPNGSNMPSNAAGTSFYDDSSDNHSVGSQLSPGFRPGTARTGNTIGSEPDVNGHDDERRPSLASITTVSSSGSKGSIVRSGIHKKLQGFFGEEFPGRDGSDTSLPTQGLVGKEHRSNSYSRHRDRKTSSATETGAREASPAPSRPRTPVPSSDVVPFLYQDSQVCRR